MALPNYGRSLKRNHARSGWVSSQIFVSVILFWDMHYWDITIFRQVRHMTSSVHNPPYKRFCRLIIAYRQRQGLTQTQLAEKLNRPQSFVSKYENGDRRIDLVEFMEIAAALEIDPLEFIRDFRDAAAEENS
jgi:DNA-binding transcriptional regulator YiaG